MADGGVAPYETVARRLLWGSEIWFSLCDKTDSQGVVARACLSYHLVDERLLHLVSIDRADPAYYVSEYSILNTSSRNGRPICRIEVASVSCKVVVEMEPGVAQTTRSGPSDE